MVKSSVPIVNNFVKKFGRKNTPIVRGRNDAVANNAARFRGIGLLSRYREAFAVGHNPYELRRRPGGRVIDLEPGFTKLSK